MKAVGLTASFEDAARKAIEFAGYVGDSEALQRVLREQPEEALTLMQPALALALTPYTERLSARRRSTAPADCRPAADGDRQALVGFGHRLRLGAGSGGTVGSGWGIATAQNALPRSVSSRLRRPGRTWRPARPWRLTRSASGWEARTS